MAADPPQPEPQHPPTVQLNDRSWTITFLLANLEGRGSRKPPDDLLEIIPGQKLKRDDERFRLFKNVLKCDKCDIVLLQEPTQIDQLKALDGYHTVLEKKKQASQAGMLLDGTKYGRVESFTEQYLRSFLGGRGDPHDVNFDVFMKHIQEGTMCIRKATPTTGNYSILLVSYHGPNFKRTAESKDDRYREHYGNFIKAWTLIHNGIGAEHIVIGGDFNFAVEKFREMVPYHEHGLSVYSQVNRTEHRIGAYREKYIIDYFLVSKSLELVECVMAQRLDWNPALVNYANYYFDHDPVVAKFTVSAGTTDPLTHMMQELSLVSGPSVMAREAVICDWQRTHFTVVLQKLRSLNSRIWNEATIQSLSSILQSRNEMETFNVEELREILQHLKINVPTGLELNKGILIDHISRIKVLTNERLVALLMEVKSDCLSEGDGVSPDLHLLETILQSPEQLDKRDLIVILQHLGIDVPDSPKTNKRKLINHLPHISHIKILTNEELKTLLQQLKSVVPDGVTPDLDLLQNILQSPDKLHRLQNEEVNTIVPYLLISHRQMLIDILYQVYQWPLGKLITQHPPSYDELLNEFYGLHGLNIPL